MEGHCRGLIPSIIPAFACRDLRKTMNILSHGIQSEGVHIRSRNATLSTEIFTILPRLYVKLSPEYISILISELICPRYRSRSRLSLVQWH
jgi:hypothetical protein